MKIKCHVIAHTQILIDQTVVSTHLFISCYRHFKEVLGCRAQFIEPCNI